VHRKLTRFTTNKIKDLSIGVIDDTMSHKPYAKKMEHVGFFHDGLTKKEVKGHSIVTHGVHSQELGLVPVDIELYRKDGRTKNDIACDMIQRTQRYKKLQLFVLDSWYSNVQVLGKICKRGSHFITEIKSNRNITIDNKRRWAREHERSIKESQYKTASINGSFYRYFQTCGFICGLGNVNLIFSQKFEEGEGKWGETYYLTTDVLSLAGKRAIELFLVRSGIEGFHREAKQQLGLEHYQLRTDRGIARYLFLVMFVYVLLLLLNKQQMRNSLERKTIGEMCRYLKAECYTTLLQRAKHLDKTSLAEFSRELAYGL
jgi:hypothetical protein